MRITTRMVVLAAFLGAGQIATPVEADDGWYQPGLTPASRRVAQSPNDFVPPARSVQITPEAQPDMPPPLSDYTTDESIFATTPEPPDYTAPAGKSCQSSCSSAGCGCASSCNTCCDHKLLGLISRSDHCFDRFISPISNPVLFEDPRSLTELRPMFLYQKMPSETLGGQLYVYAMQVRAALNENLSIIATKDGWIDIDADNIPDQDGWSNVSLGLKGVLIRDVQSQFLLTGGFTYEMGSGSDDVFQGIGDGDFHLFLTAGKEFCCNAHWISSIGYRLPVDSAQGSQMFYWSNHWDYMVGHGFYALTELNWYHWTKSGGGPITGFEGGDIINLGSADVAGNDITELAIGGKWKPNGCRELGVAWSFPISNRKDLLESRLIVDYIIRY